MNKLKEKRSAMRVTVEDWQSSSESKKEYCLEKDINEWGFCYWFSQTNGKENTSLGFIPILQHSSMR